jgi:hypothetical protein
MDSRRIALSLTVLPLLGGYRRRVGRGKLQRGERKLDLSSVGRSLPLPGKGLVLRNQKGRWVSRRRCGVASEDEPPVRKAIGEKLQNYTDLVGYSI